MPSWESLALRVLGGRYRYVMPEHLNYFTSATLQRLLQNPERAGGAWALVALTTTHFNPVVIWQDLRRRPGELVPDADRARLLQKTNRLKNNPLLRPVRWAYGAAEWMLGGLGLADNLVAVIQRSR